MRKRIIALLLCFCTLLMLMPLQSFAEGTEIEPNPDPVPSPEPEPKPITPLQILKQPSNGRAAIGETVYVTVEAVGDELQYQWYVRNPDADEFSVSAVTTRTYSCTITEKNSGRELYCVVSDKHGNTEMTRTVNISTPVTLKILQQPDDVYANAGDMVETAVVAQGDNLKYQWYLKNPGMTGFCKSSTTTSVYSWTLTEKNSGRQVYCVITDRYGKTVRTETVTLKMTEELAIVKQPNHVGVSAGATAKASVTAAGDGLRYQWYFKNPTAKSFSKSSITANTYTWKMTAKDSGRQVYCVITDVYGETLKTNTVTLKIPTQLKITKQPADVLANVGVLGKTSVTATGDGLQYQWYLKNAGATGFATSSLTGNSYSVTMSKNSIGRQVYCVITDMFGNQVRTNTVTFAVAKAEVERTLYKVKPGATKKLDITIKPANTQDAIIWTSSNTAVAKVNSKGVVTGVKNGTVTITARGVNTGFIATCKVKVCNVKQVAITFDDGPGKYTPELLDFLKENDIRVTFFLVGNRLSSYPSTVKRQVAEGHEIGYHSWKHDIQTKLTNTKIISDYEKSARILKNISGAKFTLWRAPGGGISDRVLKQIDLPHIMWSVDTLDWKYRETDRTCRVIKNGAKDGAIILLHDIHKTTVKGAMKALKEMQAGDYEFITVSEMLSRNGKKPKNHATYSHG